MIKNATDKNCLYLSRTASKILLIISKKEKLKKEKKGNKNSIKTTIIAPHYENNEVPDVYQIKKKGIPFFHNTTVNIVDDDYKEKYRVILNGLSKM